MCAKRGKVHDLYVFQSGINHGIKEQLLLGKNMQSSKYSFITYFFV